MYKVRAFYISKDIICTPFLTCSGVYYYYYSSAMCGWGVSVCHCAKECVCFGIYNCLAPVTHSVSTNFCSRRLFIITNKHVCTTAHCRFVTFIQRQRRTHSLSTISICSRLQQLVDQQPDGGDEWNNKNTAKKQQQQSNTCRLSVDDNNW